MQTEKTEGIALKTVPYKDGQKILTIFAEKRGLTTLLVKRLSLKRMHLFSGTNLFSLSEFVYFKGKSDIYYLQDLSLIREHSFLREELNYIEQAALMARALLDSQLPNKKAPALYALFKKYILKIPAFKNELTLSYSFMLKLLIHEGLLHLTGSCSSCQNTARYIVRGELLCPLHAPSYALSFSSLEMESLKLLAHSRTFENLKSLQLSKSLQDKIWRMFKEIV